MKSRSSGKGNGNNRAKERQERKKYRVGQTGARKVRNPLRKET